MSKYIDAEHLKAEIDRLLAKAENDEKKAFAKKDAFGHLAAVTTTTVYVKIKKLISTLQQEQPEVELEREIRDYFSKWDYSPYDGVITMDNDIVATLSSIKNVARHFYDLGCRHTAVLYDDIEFERQRREEQELPAGLDEAAREFAKTTFTRPLSDTPEQELIIIEPDKLAGFIAGAEWMAGQGVSMIINDDNEWADVDSFIHKNVGGGSIIQIRKK